MLNQHPSSEDLENFLHTETGSGSATRNAKVLRHLLAECTSCRQRLAQLGWGSNQLERLVALDSSEVQEGAWNTNLGSRYRSQSYDRAFERASLAVEAFLQDAPAPEAPVEALMAELDTLESAQLGEASDLLRFRNAQVVRHLVERSHGLRFSNPQRMLLSAKLALDLAVQCTPGSAGNLMKLMDLQGLAWSQYATALRISGQLRESEAATESANGCLKVGTGDPELKATVYRQTASLLTALRRFEAAIGMLQEAGSISRLVGDSHALATALVLEAIATIYAGRAESATRLLNQAIPLIDQEVDPHLLLAACHNLVRCYIDLDRPEQALALYTEVSELYKDLREELLLLRAAWLEGQLLRDLGHPQAAETILLRARQGYLENQIMYEAALVSLDLASIYIKLGRVVDVQRTAEATVPIFRSLGIEREELAGLLQLQQVAGQQQKALDLVRFLNQRIQQSGTRDDVLQ